jgi:hypothetical protein
MPTLPMRAATLIGLAVVTGGVWLSDQGQGERSAKYQLPGPPDRTLWVPFSAQLERVTPDGVRFVFDAVAARRLAPGSPTALMMARFTPSADIEGLGVLSRERDEELFEPQPGDPIERSSKPGGIHVVK